MNAFIYICTPKTINKHIFTLVLAFPILLSASKSVFSASQPQGFNQVYPNKIPQILDLSSYREITAEYLIGIVQQDDVVNLERILKLRPDLLNKEVSINNRLIHIASDNKSYQCIAKLVTLGADIYAKDMFGETLIDAAHHDNTIAEIIRGNHVEN